MKTFVPLVCLKGCLKKKRLNAQICKLSLGLGGRFLGPKKCYVKIECMVISASFSLVSHLMPPSVLLPDRCTLLSDIFI